MADPTSANYIFLPWVRQGAAAGIRTPDEGVREPEEPGEPPVQPVFATLSVRLRVKATERRSDGQEIERDVPLAERGVRLYGPGDIVGIDPRQVVRTEPRHHASDFEPNYFPAVEFDSPEFPWLFTPARSGVKERLRPWLCLVVVRKQQGVTLSTDPTRPLPVLHIGTPADADAELPNLSESWAWAHAQLSGSGKDDASVQSTLARAPARTVSRVICPRRLDPQTDYLACVVPVFQLGRLAGLGQEIKSEHEKHLAPAWEPDDDEVSLPVYYHWEFRTGVAGDFETLAALLKAHAVPKEVGQLSILVNLPAPGTHTATFQMETALRVRDSEPPLWPEGFRAPFQAQLERILDAAAATPEPLVAPPLYGEWHAARHTVNLQPVPVPSHPWLDDLNLDPRHRAAAALGTRVVQEDQEHLMASAWEQLGEVEPVNQMLRQAQLARAVGSSQHARHFEKFSPEALLKVMSPAQSRVVVEEAVHNTVEVGHNVTQSRLLAKKIDASTTPSKAISAAARRLTRTRGPIASRFSAAVEATGASGMAAFVNAASTGNASTGNAGVATEEMLGGGGFFKPGPVTMDAVSARFSTTDFPDAPTSGRFDINIMGDRFVFKIYAEGADTPPQPKHWSFESPGAGPGYEGARFNQAVKVVQEYAQTVWGQNVVASVKPRETLDLDEKTRDSLLKSIDPELTIPARVQAALTVDGKEPPARPDLLATFTDTPTFPRPMYEALRDLSQDFLLPGLEKVPSNSVTLLEPNPEFIESFMVGLNTEMGRELLWRRCPADQRGTYFRWFWRGPEGDEDEHNGGEFQPITRWRMNGLGGNSSAGGDLVLLVRGDLLRRYPNSVIYAVRAAHEADGRLGLKRDAEEHHPIFRGTLKPDVTFLGFDLPEDPLVGDGYFFVIQEQPTEPRFGMDEADFTKPLRPLTTWSNLSWRHLVGDAGTEADLKKISHVSPRSALPGVSAPAGAWGHNSAHQAFITLQRPVRVAIHASQLIP